MTNSLAVALASFTLGLGIGIITAEEKDVVNLKPCPKQTGMVVKSSVSVAGELTCYYAPEKLPKKI